MYSGELRNGTLQILRAELPNLLSDAKWSSERMNSSAAERVHGPSLRNMRKFKPAFKTNRFGSSFITFNALKAWTVLVDFLNLFYIYIFRAYI